MRAMDFAGEPEVLEVRKEEDAALGFRGSPSVAINGVDVDEKMADATPGLHWG